jgi:hypothetical protein
MQRTLTALASLLVACACAHGTAQEPEPKMTPASRYQAAPAAEAFQTAPADPAVLDEGHVPGADESRAATQSDCPMALGAVSVRAGAIDGGMTIDFASSDVSKHEELRRRVRRLADSWASGPGQAGLSEDDAEDGTAPQVTTRTASAHGGGLTSEGAAHVGMTPTLSAVVSDTPNGARLIATPTQASDLTAVRERLEQQVELMRRTRQCAPAH